MRTGRVPSSKHIEEPAFSVDRDCGVKTLMRITWPIAGMIGNNGKIGGTIKTTMGSRARSSGAGTAMTRTPSLL